VKEEEERRAQAYYEEGLLLGRVMWGGMERGGGRGCCGQEG
jgi:hypothetical protein